MPVLLQTTLLLICSNVSMTFAEYLLQVPANRIGYTTMNLGQLKILQEVIALSVFVPFAVLDPLADIIPAS